MQGSCLCDLDQHVVAVRARYRPGPHRGDERASLAGQTLIPIVAFRTCRGRLPAERRHRPSKAIGEAVGSGATTASGREIDPGDNAAGCCRRSKQSPDRRADASVVFRFWDTIADLG